MKMVDENSRFYLNPGEIHVWLFDLDESCQELSECEQLLSRDETERSKRYRFEQDRMRFITRRGILRLLLGDYTGLEPAEIVYHTNPFGKLSLPSHALKFNLSICQNRGIFVFVLDKEIGVDLEQFHSFPELDRMAELLFSPVEQAGLFALAPEIQMEAFIHIWTQKEAFLKAHGEGLSFPLQDFSVSVDPHLPGVLLAVKDGAVDVSAWKMYTHSLKEGGRVAVCAESEVETQVIWQTLEPANLL